MIAINPNRNFCYRICHLQNLPNIVQVGLCTRHHPGASSQYITIGNPQIISRRDHTSVKIDGYGMIGEYVPFYFTPRSIMLYNIITGYWAPIVPKVEREDILVIRCALKDLASLPQFFFTDGQANDALTNHYNNTLRINKIDWEIIHASNFNKDGDVDRPRRYQAEFLVRHHVPVERIESFHTYNQKAATFVQDELEKTDNTIPVFITTAYFF